MIPIPPSALFILIGTAGGLLIGGLIAWLRLSGLRSEYRVKMTALNETLKTKAAEADSIQSRLVEANRELAANRESLMTMSANHSNAIGRLERLDSIEKQLAERTDEVSGLNRTITALKEHSATLTARLDQERSAAEEKQAMLAALQEQMTDSYRALSASALKENNRAFMDLAQATLSRFMETASRDLDQRGKSVRDTVKPIRESLDRYERQIQALERSRQNAYGGLTEQIHTLIRSQQALEKETGKLAKALRLPHVRGRWGEITLKRVAELAGMQERCDFFEQQSVRTDNGTRRPDMVVHLPENRHIIVDAKVPLSAYLDALEAESDEARAAQFAAHARQVKTHTLQLARKAYWRQFDPAPEFVVLFIPGENFFSAALANAPDLIETAAEKGVILATPTTLISLLKTVAFGWRQETMAHNARTVSELGAALYERLTSMADHLDQLGRSIDRSVSAYNRVIGSFERRVLVSARKFQDLGITTSGGKELAIPASVDEPVRKLTRTGTD